MSLEEGSEQKILYDLAELTAASVAVAMADYSALLPIVERVHSANDKETIIKELSEGTKTRAHALLILARSLVQYGEELNELDPDDDPRVLLPLLHSLADSFAILALSREEEDLQIHLLLDGEGLERLLTPDTIAFIKRWGQERAEEALQAI